MNPLIAFGENLMDRFAYGVGNARLSGVIATKSVERRTQEIKVVCKKQNFIKPEIDAQV